MAGVRFHGTSGEVSLSAATLKTVLQLVAASNHRVLLKGLEIFFKGTSATDTPVRVRMLKQTDAGTMTSLTLAKNNAGDDETLQTTAQHTATAEPTAGTVLKTYDIHPQTGLVIFFPLGEEIVLKGGERLGFDFLAAQAQTAVVNVYGDE